MEPPQLHVVHAADLSLTGPRRVLIAQRVASAHHATNRPNARFGAGTGDGRLVETRLDAPTKGVFNPASRPGPVSRVPRLFGRDDRGLWAPFDPAGAPSYVCIYIYIHISYRNATRVGHLLGREGGSVQ